jgi:hypothetical protein
MGNLFLICCDIEILFFKNKRKKISSIILNNQKKIVQIIQ